MPINKIDLFNCENLLELAVINSSVGIRWDYPDFPRTRSKFVCPTVRKIGYSGADVAYFCDTPF